MATGQLDRCTAKAPGLVLIFPEGRAFALTLNKDADLSEYTQVSPGTGGFVYGGARERRRAPRAALPCAVLPAEKRY